MTGKLIIPTCLAALFALTTAGGEPSQGNGQVKRQLDDMQGIITAAKSIEVIFEIQVTLREAPGPEKSMDLEGSLVVSDGNRVREDIHERMAGQPVFKALVSDGHQWWWHDKGSPPHRVNRPLGSNFTAEALITFARVGIYLPTLPLPPVAAKDANERFPTASVRLGAKEKVAGREAQRVDFDLFIKGQNRQDGSPMPFAVSLWIDPTSHLPVKRTITQSDRGAPSVSVTETYRKVDVDKPVKAKTFALPDSTPDTIVEP